MVHRTGVVAKISLLLKHSIVYMLNGAFAGRAFGLMTLSLMTLICENIHLLDIVYHFLCAGYTPNRRIDVTGIEDGDCAPYYWVVPVLIFLIVYFNMAMSSQRM